MAKINLKMFHTKVFLATFIFCVLSGFYENVAFFLPLFLEDAGYTVVETGVITYALGVVVFVWVSALFFAILYMLCKRGFMENIASIIISLIIGAVLGHWIGGLASLLLQFRFVGSPSISTLTTIISTFGACSAAYLNSKWKAAPIPNGMFSKRPIGVTLITILYAVLGVLSAVLTIALWGFPNISFEALYTKIILFAVLTALFSTLTAVYLFFAHGFYRGKRWAWLIVFASTLITILLTINQLVYTFHFDLFFIARILTLILNIFILIYTLQTHVRIYFNIVNLMPES
ncbi:MAG: hypothetical protein ACUVTE_07075 [Candidatus Bathycorpusculaceae bacterium]